MTHQAPSWVKQSLDLLDEENLLSNTKTIFGPCIAKLSNHPGPVTPPSADGA